MVISRYTKRVLLSVAPRVIYYLETKLLGHSRNAAKSGLMKNIHCSNCCACPRVPHEADRIAMALMPFVRAGRGATPPDASPSVGFAEVGDARIPDVCPTLEAKKRPKRRIQRDTHKREGMSPMGRRSPPPPPAVASRNVSPVMGKQALLF